MDGIINIGILAHVDAGKTTTTEQMLFLAGAIAQAGSIEKGNTQTDFMDIERRRGISVRASATALTWDGVRLNVIDTPGHMDFTGEVERALLALDAVVLVVSAMEGIQSQTELFWKAAHALRLPTIFFINKIDRAGCKPELVAESLRETFSTALVPLNAPERAGARDCGVTPRALSEDDLYLLAEHDDALAERLLREEKVTQNDAAVALQRAVCDRAVFPVVYGAAAQKVGVADLLAAVAAYFPRQKEADNAPLSGIVYKLEHDSALGKVAHVRLFAGTLAPKDMIPLRRGEERFEEKVNQIYIVNSAKREDVRRLSAGQVGAVCGLVTARCGDVLGEAWLSRHYPIATPLFSSELNTEAAQLPALVKAVAELSDEDPILDYKWAADERELSVQLMGPIQLEILDSLLRERYNIAATFSTPTVIYKETPAQPGIGFEAYTMPKPCWAILKLAIEPAPRGSGYHFNVAGDLRQEKLNDRYRHHIEQSLTIAIKQGLYNWEVVDLNITLIDGEQHIYHTHPMDFFLATPLALLDGLNNCGATLLEPMLLARMEADESLSGKLIGEVLGMRGSFDAPVMRGGRLTMEARLPVAAARDFPIRFAALTAGKGRYRTRFDGYRECPLELGETAKRRGVDPRDRSKWILHMRNALA